ncbi:hypothetical protein OQH61_08920, partial [Helicobacter sp. MIT 21-1697]|uniref:hypothetical protein n=1 Tax=Helicobacter sp. MIT 21-1697 TaxID=2993733 RepID=UPI002B05AD39
TFIYIILAFIVCVGVGNATTKLQKHIDDKIFVLVGIMFVCSVLTLLTQDYNAPFLYFNF